jgi:hypothetical protein
VVTAHAVNCDDNPRHGQCPSCTDGIHLAGTTPADLAKSNLSVRVLAAMPGLPLSLSCLP